MKASAIPTASKRERDQKKEKMLWDEAFIKTTYNISLDSQISLLPLGFSPHGQEGRLTVRIREDKEIPSGNRMLDGIS